MEGHGVFGSPSNLGEGRKKPLNPRFDQGQYDRIRRCSEKGDWDEWNEWRKACPTEEILLDCADLRDARLSGAYLSSAHLAGADLRGACLDGAYLGSAHLEGAILMDAHIEGADLGAARLDGANLWFADLTGADLGSAHLNDADLGNAHLEGAHLVDAHLEGAHMVDAHIEGADFTVARVDGRTLIWECLIDEKTNFTGVGLAQARVNPGLLPLIEYNIRRRHWEAWYKVHPRLRLIVAFFWLISDYGRATGRIVQLFFGFALSFAAVYLVSEWIGKPLLGHGFLANFSEADGLSVSWWLLPLRAAYFSIVTMTTLGFGDMHVYPQSLLGHIVVMLQVLLGYIVLGALITRFAVLFTTGSPANSSLMQEKTTSWQHFRQMAREDFRSLRGGNGPRLL